MSVNKLNLGWVGLLLASATYTTTNHPYITEQWEPPTPNEFYDAKHLFDIWPKEWQSNISLYAIGSVSTQTT